MRLGGQVCKACRRFARARSHGKAEIVERHRHRYEVNNVLLGQLEEKGLRSPAGRRAQICAR